MTRREANNYYPHLMAKIDNLDVNATGATDLPFVEGATLETHTPLFAIAVYQSGTVGTLEFEITVDGTGATGTIVGSSTGLSAGRPKLAIDMLKSGQAVTNNPIKVISVDVTTASGAACTVSVYVYGIEL